MLRVQQKKNPSNNKVALTVVIKLYLSLIYLLIYFHFVPLGAQRWRVVDLLVSSLKFCLNNDSHDQLCPPSYGDVGGGGMFFRANFVGAGVLLSALHLMYG